MLSLCSRRIEQSVGVFCRQSLSMRDYNVATTMLLLFAITYLVIARGDETAACLCLKALVDARLDVLNKRDALRGAHRKPAV